MLRGEYVPNERVRKACRKRRASCGAQARLPERNDRLQRRQAIFRLHAARRFRPRRTHRATAQRRRASTILSPMLAAAHCVGVPDCLAQRYRGGAHFGRRAPAVAGHGSGTAISVAALSRAGTPRDQPLRILKQPRCFAIRLPRTVWRRRAGPEEGAGSRLRERERPARVDPASKRASGRREV